MEYEICNVKDLIPFVDNPRVNDHAVEAAAKAIKEFGFRVPILIRGKGEIVDGHLRLKAAKMAGLIEVPVMRADDLSEKQVKAFRISINKIAELADWDEDLLRTQLKELQEDDYDLGLIGYDDVELDSLLIGETKGKTGPDDVPPVPDNPVSVEGDVWIMGNHRLMCGDTTRKEDLATLMAGEKSHMVFTDPPYNVDYEGKANQGKIKNDKMNNDKLHRFLLSAFTEMALALISGGGVYVAHADIGETGITFRRAFLGAGLKMSACLIWRKNQAMLGRSDYQWQHEPILYGWKEGAAHRWYGDRKQKTIQEFFDGEIFAQVDENEYQINLGGEILVVSGKDITVRSEISTIVLAEKPIVSKLHPTMKPVALIEKFMKNSSVKGNIVLDGFGGSGSTLIACEKTGRFARLMELDPKFVDVIVCRWQDFTGMEAILADDGQTFKDVKMYRQG